MSVAVSYPGSPAVGAEPAVKPKAGVRLQNIDAVRGLVMVFMLLDHLRETWLVNVPVADPVDVRTTIPAIVMARFLVSLCAPIFVALTGVGVFLFRANHTLEETTSYLLKRGLLLMALDVFLLSELYWGITEPTVWLQVIWTIGVCMLVLIGLIRLPLKVIFAIGLVIVAGHNLLDPIQLQPGNPWLPLWAELHQRALMDTGLGIHVKTTYPVLAWIGVIALGYCAGSWFLPDVSQAERQRRFTLLGLGLLVGFVVLRLVNTYGDKPWFVVEGDPFRTFLSFISLTKYPPSLLFLMPTLGFGALFLAMFDRIQGTWLSNVLSVFGGAPLFFYILHLCVLRILYHTAYAIYGPTDGKVFMVSSYNWVLAWYAIMIVPLYLPTAWFSRLKRRRRDLAWLRYF